MTIYIENVIIDNFAMTYLISDLSYKIGGMRGSKTRCVCASAAGTAVAVFYPFIYDGIALFAVRAGLFAVMSLILYAGKRKKTLPLIFLAVTAAVGGATFFTAFALGGSVSETLPFSTGSGEPVCTSRTSPQYANGGIHAQFPAVPMLNFRKRPASPMVRGIKVSAQRAPW